MRGPADPTSGEEPTRASSLTVVQPHSPQVHKDESDARKPWERPPDPGNKAAAKACQGQDGGEVVYLSRAAHHNSTGGFRASVPRVVVEPYAGRLFITVIVMPDGKQIYVARRCRLPPVRAGIVAALAFETGGAS